MGLSWLFWISIILVNAILVPYFMFLLVIAIAALLPRKKLDLSKDPVSKFLFLIPAHDEEAGISHAVGNCLGVNYPRSLFEVMVIADNCTDQTAAQARNAGARVVERFDDVRQSKGYALNDQIDRLETGGELSAWDAVVIVDADTTVSRDLLRAFDSDLRRGIDWIQAYYTVANPDSSWRTRLITYAFSLFNGVMPLGKSRLGVSSALNGNGMCFSVRGLRKVPWRSRGLVEDMEYAWDVRLAGGKIAFQPDVSIRAEMLSSGGRASANQRKRWEFGRWQIRTAYFGPLLRSKRLGLWTKFLSLCELTMPTMAMLTIIYVVVAAVDGSFILAPVEPPIAFFRRFLVACAAIMRRSRLLSMRVHRSLQCACPSAMPSAWRSFPVILCGSSGPFRVNGPIAGFAPPESRSTKVPLSLPTSCPDALPCQDRPIGSCAGGYEFRRRFVIVLVSVGPTLLSAMFR